MAENCPAPCNSAQTTPRIFHALSDHDCRFHDRSRCAQCREADGLIAEVEQHLAICADFHGRVLQDPAGRYHPWFELEPERFTCAKSWAAAEARRQVTPDSSRVSRSLNDVQAGMAKHGGLVDVTDQYPRDRVSGEQS